MARIVNLKLKTSDINDDGIRCDDVSFDIETLVNGTYETKNFNSVSIQLFEHWKLLRMFDGNELAKALILVEGLSHAADDSKTKLLIIEIWAKCVVEHISTNFVKEDDEVFNELYRIFRNVIVTLIYSGNYVCVELSVAAMQETLAYSGFGYDFCKAVDNDHLYDLEALRAYLALREVWPEPWMEAAPEVLAVTYWIAAGDLPPEEVEKFKKWMLTRQDDDKLMLMIGLYGLLVTVDYLEEGYAKYIDEDELDDDEESLFVVTVIEFFVSLIKMHQKQIDRYNILRVLLSAGSRDSTWFTQYSEGEILKVLRFLDSQFSLNIHAHSESILRTALKEELPEITTYLINRGANITATLATKNMKSVTGAAVDYAKRLQPLHDILRGDNNLVESEYAAFYENTAVQELTLQDGNQWTVDDLNRAMDAATADRQNAHPVRKYM